MDKKEMGNKANALIQKGKVIAQKVAETAKSDETKEKVNKLKGQAQYALNKSAEQAKSAAKVAKAKGGAIASNASSDSMTVYNKVPAIILLVYLVSFFLPSARVYGVSVSINEFLDSSALTLYYFVIVAAIGACLFGANTVICRSLVALVVVVVAFNVAKNAYDAFELAQSMSQMMGHSRVRVDLGDILELVGIKSLGFGVYVFALSFLALIPFTFKKYQSRSVIVATPEPVEAPEAVEQDS